MAREKAMVDFTKVSASIIQNVQNLHSVDAVIANDPKTIDDFFGNGDLSLKYDEVFIMSGTRGTVKLELDKYRTRSISLAGARGADYLDIRGYYVKKRARGKESTVYIIISANTWRGYRSWPEVGFPNRGAGAVPLPNRNSSVPLADIADRLLELAKANERDVKTNN
jgi:hypothetical protein